MKKENFSEKYLKNAKHILELLETKKVLAQSLILKSIVQIK